MRRGGAKCLAKASKASRPEETRLRGRVRDEHSPRPAIRVSTQGREGFRQGTEELGQENVTLIDRRPFLYKE